MKVIVEFSNLGIYFDQPRGQQSRQAECVELIHVLDRFQLRATVAQRPSPHPLRFPLFATCRCAGP